MTIWDILQIEQTRDKDALKKAYRMRLSSVNPEDDPQGFMELRRAYEEALRLADAEEAEPSETPEAPNEAEAKLEEIYRDFNRRISAEAWVELFNTDVFVSLDTGEEAFFSLLKFLADHIFLPRRIFRLISEHFDMEERRKELSEHFPVNYLDFITGDYEDVIDYDCFTGTEGVSSEQIDSFLHAYSEMERCVRRGESEDAGRRLEDLQTSYPFTNACLKLTELRLKLLQDHAASAACKIYEQAKILADQYPNSRKILLFCTDAAMFGQEPEEAEAYLQKAETIEPDSYPVRLKKAELRYRCGDYKEARDLYLNLLSENHYDENARIGMIRANQNMIEADKERLREAPEDFAARMELAWSLYQTYQFSEAIHVLSGVRPDAEHAFEYCNVLGRCYLSSKKYESALHYFREWKRLIEELPANDRSEDTENKRKRYPYVNYLMACCYMKLKNYDAASDFLKTALSEDHDEIMLSYEADCELKFRTGQYSDCLKACETLLEMDPEDYAAYLFKARACKHLKYIQEALTACEQAISLYPYFSHPYAVETQILLEAEQTEQAEKTIARYDALNVGKSDWIDYYRARIRLMNRDMPGAIKILEEIIHRSDPENTDMERFEDVCLVLGICRWTLDEYEPALVMFERVKELTPDQHFADVYIGSCCSALGKYDRALKVLTDAVEAGAGVRAYNERGHVYDLLGKFTLAMSDYRAALNLDPENTYARMRVGEIYEYHQNYRQAANAYESICGQEDTDSDTRAKAIQNLARVYQCLNWLTESRDLYLQYGELFGMNADIAYDYSVLLTRIGDTDGAVGILKSYQDDPACIHRLIQIYGESGYIDLAHEAFERAIFLNENDFAAYGMMGEAFRAQRLYADAAEIYKRAIDLDTEKKSNYYCEWKFCVSQIKSVRNLKKARGDKSFHAEETVPNEKIYSPRQAIRLAKLYSSAQNGGRHALAVLDAGLHCRRCHGCFYGACHRILYEKAQIYERMRCYSMARKMYEEAIRICGQNAFYEACLKRIKDK